MKKIATTLIFALICGFSFGQGNGHHGNSNDEHWDIFGNSIDAQDVFGTLNNFPINFITNGTQKMMLGTNGVLQINNLSGTGTRILQTDANGNVKFLPSGLTGQFLQSDGTWADLPSSATAWKVIGNDIFNTNTGNVGIGTYTPQYKLDVLGDARISNNLFVGGGIVITDKVDASTEVKTGDVIVNGFGTFNGGARFAGVLTATQGIMFDNAGSKGISFTSGTGGNPDVYSFGRLGGGTGPVVNPCFAPVGPTSLTRWEFPGVMQIYSADNAGNYVTGKTILTMASWGDGSSLDVAGGNPGSLLIDYFCGKDVAICTGSLGGIVSMGNQVSMANSARIGYDGTNPIDVTTALSIFNGSRDGIKFTSPYNNTKLISISNSNLPGVSPFLVNGDGTSQINTFNTSEAFAIKGYDGINFNKVLSINGDGRTSIGDSYIPTGYMLAVKGKIISEEVVVELRGNWPDYVFNKEYKLIPLKDLETFIKNNKHLPNIPSAKQITKDGVPVGDLVKKQMEKIEELTLYMIDQQKQIDELKKQVETLSKK